MSASVKQLAVDRGKNSAVESGGTRSDLENRSVLDQKSVMEMGHPSFPGSELLDPTKGEDSPVLALY